MTDIIVKNMKKPDKLLNLPEVGDMMLQDRLRRKKLKNKPRLVIAPNFPGFESRMTCCC